MSPPLSVAAERPAVNPVNPYGLPPALRAPLVDALGDGLLMRVLEEIDYGLMLVTEGGRVCFANHVALRECACGHPMQISGGHVQPRLAREQEAFFNALGASCLGRRAMLTLHSDESAVSIALVPLGEPAGAHGEPAVLLVFGKRQLCEPLTVEFYARAHHLTASETMVLKGLCAGQRPRQIAEQAGVAISTVRSHIGNIRIKTATASITELVRIVTVLPPIVPALNRMNWSAGLFGAAAA